MVPWPIRQRGLMSAAGATTLRLTLHQGRLIVDGLITLVEWRFMEIRVEGSLDQAMRVLKRKLAKEGVFKEMKKRAFYEKPSVRRKRKRSEAQRRRRKEQRRRRASAI
jgi:small subunit ribosomal protein S21